MVEFLLVIVIIGLLAGVTAYVYTQKNNSNKVLNAATANSETTKAQPGTTESIDALTQSEGNSEQSAASANDGATSQAATSDSSSLNTMGGAYNESSL